jgi:hypothetical protein
MEIGMWMVVAAIGVVVGGLGAAVLIWRWRTERENDFAQATLPTSTWNPAPEIKITTTTDPQSILSRWVGSAMPDLAGLQALSKIATSARWKSADGKPLSQEEQLAALRTALEQAQKELPDNPLLQKLRASIEQAATTAEGNETSPVRVFRVGNQTKIQYHGVEFSEVESIPEESAREQAKTLLALMR